MYIIKMWVILESLVPLIKEFILHYTLNATSQDMLTIRKGITFTSFIALTNYVCTYSYMHRENIINMHKLFLSYMAVWYCL